MHKLFTLALLSALASPVAAQFPNKPVRLIVGFPAGGGADIMTRVVAQGLAKELGEQVLVDNRPGADATIATAAVARAAPDGYTLLMGTNTAMVAMPTQRSDLPYDPFRDFTPISSAGQFSKFLVVNNSLPVQNVNELLDYTMANPGKLNSAYSNSAAQLAMVQLLATNQSKVLSVPYKGDAPALIDVMGGNIHMIFTTGGSAPPLVKQGKVRALMTLQPQRSSLLPDVPTAVELGFRQLTIVPWAGFFGPAGIPPDVTNRLSEALQKVLKQPEVRAQLLNVGFEGYGMSPAQFGKFFRDMHETWVRTVRENNIRFEQ
jgi:tripartite-type tricarboxylate transporter receptor subunit TctC